VLWIKINWTKIEQYFIKIKHYFTWFLVNFIICLFPITVYLLIKNSVPQVFSGFLSFSYTLLIVSLYLFMGHFKKSTTERIFPELRMWLTIFFISFIWGYFWVYNSSISISVNDYVNTHIVSFFVLILIVTFALSLCLNIPLIRDSINDEISKRRRQKAKSTGERVRGFKDELEEEGDRV